MSNGHLKLNTVIGMPEQIAYDNIYKTRLKRIESKIAREAVFKTQNTSKT